MIATQSRGGLLGVLVIFGVFAIKKIQSKLLLGSLMVTASLLLFVVAGILCQSGGAGEEGIDASAQGRLYAWEAAVVWLLIVL